MVNHCIHLFIVLLLFLTACNNVTERSGQQKVPQKNAGYVVIFIENAPINRVYKWPDGVTSGSYPTFELRYIDDDALAHYYLPKESLKKDTLVLYTERDRVEVQHAYNGIDVLSYLFQNGDSVLFTYEGQKPTATILNRNALTWDLNYDLRKRTLISGEDFPGLVRTELRFAFKDSTFLHIENLHERVAEARRIGYQIALSEQNLELLLLDSLRKHNLLSEETYSYYRDKSFFDIANQHLFFPLDSAAVSGQEKIYSAEQLKEVINNSEASYFYFEKMLRGLRIYYFEKKVDFIKTLNANYIDFRQLYDSINESKLFDANAKQRLLFMTIKEIIETFSIQDRQEYLNKFKSDVPDTVLYNHLIKKYELDRPISDKLLLQTFDGTKTNLNEVLARHKGKVVYVDFWASWCAPCLRAMPASEKMQEEYKDSDVVFVFISIDEDGEKWRKTATKYGLHQKKENYLVDNFGFSKMQEDLDVKSIPRYMIYDRNGVLVHPNAPAPGSSEVKKLFGQHLKTSGKVSLL